MPHVTPFHSIPGQVADPTPCAVFEYDQQGGVWYLKNLTLPKMLFRVPNDPSGSWRQCAINMSIPLEMDMLIQFGDAPNHYRADVEMVRVN
jgi:hypothetical protein